MTLESLLRRDRLVTAVGLALLCVLAWVYILSGAGLGMSVWDMTRLSLFPHGSAAPSMAGIPMSGMDMAGMDMSGMTAEPAAWGVSAWLLTGAMWWIMMVAMMTPAAAPTVLLYAQVHRHAGDQAQSQRLAPTGAFAVGYLLVWLAFSVVAVIGHWALRREGWVAAETMGSQSRWLSGAVLIAAGVYQFSPLQSLCLRHCRSPAAFLARHWRPGVAGAVRLGVLHGAYCVGCCWALMALLFVGGVMNLAWIAALTLLVMAEKVLPHGGWVARGAGVAMLVWGGATLLV